MCDEDAMIEFMLVTDSGSFCFDAAFVSLGRDRRCTFVLPDASVLPLHAAIVAIDGRLYLERRHRDALTFLNRAPIMQRVELYDGDLIDIGPWTLIVRSRYIARRRKVWTPAELTGEFYTPSDQAIVRAVKLPRLERSRPLDDTSSSIIII